VVVINWTMGDLSMTQMLWNKGWIMWQLGEVPEAKQMSLTFRKHMKEDLWSYRLLSFLLICGKVLEQIILEVLAKHRKDKKVTQE